MPDELDVRRLIEEVRSRPIIWDVRFGEYKDRTNTPQQWAEIASLLGVDVESCKRKWKNLRDAYRAEVRRIERRVERLKSTGTYDSSKEIRSKWAYFEPMSFISDSRRPRQKATVHKSEGEGDGSNGSLDDPLGFHSFCDIKMEPHHTTDDDDCEEDDRLLEQFESAATPQAVRRLSNSISVANAAEDAATSSVAGRPESAINCKCSNRADDQVHFLENLEREEQSLMQSTRMDMTRDNSTNHVGDSDYNFLVSFLPQMKRMSELQNLQFRAKMSELLLNIMTPQPAAAPMQLIASASQFQQPQLQLQQQQRGVIQCAPIPPQLQLKPDEQQLQATQPLQQLQQQPQLQTPQCQEQFATTELMDSDTLDNSNVSVSNELCGDNSGNWP